jgi:hypothetical protein
MLDALAGQTTALLPSHKWLRYMATLQRRGSIKRDPPPAMPTPSSAALSET